jgi:hypothetical protein
MAVVTPDRFSKLVIDAPDIVLIKPSWELYRSAEEIKAVSIAGIDNLTSVAVEQTAAGDWIMAHPQDLNEHIILGNSRIQSVFDDATYPTSFTAKNSWRKPSDLTGLGDLSGLKDTAKPVLRRGVNALTQSWDDELTDELVRPPIQINPFPEPSPPLPIPKRILKGGIIYPQNQCFGIGYSKCCTKILLWWNSRNITTQN